MHMARLRCALDLGKSVAASIKARSTQKIVSLSVCIIAAKINILQPAALREPVRQPVALQQIAKRAASRHALVAHRWKNEYFVDREFFGKEPVELYIGEYAAGETRCRALVRLRSCVIERSMVRSNASWIEADASSRLTPFTIAWMNFSISG